MQVDINLLEKTKRQKSCTLAELAHSSIPYPAVHLHCVSQTEVKQNTPVHYTQTASW